MRENKPLADATNENSLRSPRMKLADISLGSALLVLQISSMNTVRWGLLSSQPCDRAEIFECTTRKRTRRQCILTPLNRSQKVAGDYCREAHNKWAINVKYETAYLALEQ